MKTHRLHFDLRLGSLTPEGVRAFNAMVTEMWEQTELRWDEAYDEVCETWTTKTLKYLAGEKDSPKA